MNANNFAIQALPAWMKHAYSKVFMCFFMMCALYAQHAVAQDVIVIVEDVQGYHGGINEALQLEKGDEVSYELSVYVGLPPGDVSNLEVIDKVEVIDENGDLVYEQVFNQKVISIPVSLLGEGEYEFRVLVDATVLSQILVIE